MPPVVAQPGQGVQSVATPETQDTQEPRRSGRTRHEPERYYGFLLTQCIDLLLVEDGEPLSFHDPMTGPDSET